MYQYKLTTKERRLEELKERLKSLEAARDAELDAAYEVVEDDDLLRAVEEEINARYIPKINGALIETQAAHMTKPRNKWFLEAMKGFCDKCLENPNLYMGLHYASFRLSLRQVEAFGRYITTPTRRVGHYGTHHGCEVDGFMIELAKFADCGFLSVTCYK